jgi:hypothetical protein
MSGLGEIPTPGARLRAAAELFCDHETVETLVLPIIGDLQHEYTEAEPGWVARRFVVARAGWGLLKAMVAYRVVRMEDAVWNFSWRNVLSLVLYWVAVAATARLVATVFPRGVIGESVGLLVACIVGLSVAFVLHARAAMYLIAGLFAAIASTLLSYVVYGGVILKTPSVVVAAGLGIALGAAVALHGGRYPARRAVRQNAAGPQPPRAID